MFLSDEKTYGTKLGCGAGGEDFGPAAGINFKKILTGQKHSGGRGGR